MKWLAHNYTSVIIGAMIVVTIFLILYIYVIGGNFNFSDGGDNLSMTSTIDVNAVYEAIRQAESERSSRIEESPSEEQIYSNPYIKHVRTALNGYLDGINAGIEEMALNNFNNTDLNCGLNSFDKAYYKSKFIVLTVEDGELGGVAADIVFVDRPDTIFLVMIYRYAGEDDEYVLRSFCANGPKAEYKKEISDVIRTMIKDGTFRYSL